MKSIESCLRNVTLKCSYSASGSRWCCFCDVRLLSAAENTVHEAGCSMGEIAEATAAHAAGGE
jgi:hypothetical protein